MLGRWADIFLIAPLSCNTLAKMASGVCDNLLMAVYLSANCPVVVAPAMDEDMWKHNSTQENIKKILTFGNKVISVEHGELASGLVGQGRMAEPEKIIDWLKDEFKQKKQLEGKRVLITAGPTFEPLDPVRFIGNFSSGKMGVALAHEFEKRGATVQLICGPSNEFIEPSIDLTRVTTASEMYEACVSAFPNIDIAVLSAAVADYTVKNPALQKIKKSADSLVLELEKTKDILKLLGSIKTPSQILVGFALETENERENALKKLANKNADYIILNSLNDKEAGFGLDTNKITIFDKLGNEFDFEAKSKTAVASDIINTILNKYE
jgi:phosphopantothenoylcysteine decarboxylase/phosphopantothenate--cysteine ligase